MISALIQKKSSIFKEMEILHIKLVCRIAINHYTGLQDLFL